MTRRLTRFFLYCARRPWVGVAINFGVIISADRLFRGEQVLPVVGGMSMFILAAETLREALDAHRENVRRQKSQAVTGGAGEIEP